MHIEATYPIDGAAFVSIAFVGSPESFSRCHFSRARRPIPANKHAMTQLSLILIALEAVQVLADVGLPHRTLEQSFDAYKTLAAQFGFDLYNMCFQMISLIANYVGRSEANRCLCAPDFEPHLKRRRGAQRKREGKAEGGKSE